MKRKIVIPGRSPSCYFRTSVKSPYRKALIQITEQCNLHCFHCFISASHQGKMISVEDIDKIVIPKLREFRVLKVTLTGGEPFCHPDIIKIVSLFRDARIPVGICTNATLISNEQI